MERERLAERDTITGDLDEFIAAPAAAAWDAGVAVAETIPTTLPGLLAMIVYAAKIEEDDPDAFTDHSPLLANLATGAKALVGREG